MQLRFRTLLLIANLFLLALPAATAQQTAVNTSPAASSSLTIPNGIVAPLTLVTPIAKKGMKAGDTVTASIAFPVTVGDQIALPVGTLAEGQITAIIKRAKKTGQPFVQIHFTRLVFANGYTSDLDATDASGFSPSSIVAPLTPREIAMQPAAPAPAPKPKGFFARLFSHNSSSKPPKILIAAGWQFQMTLQSPLTLDAASVASAAATPPK
jgi:hypothetical protein